MRLAEKKKHENKKHTGHERMYFFVALTTRERPYTHASDSEQEYKCLIDVDIHKYHSSRMLTSSYFTRNEPSVTKEKR